MTIFIIAAAGWMAAKRGYITEQFDHALVKLALVTVIPALVFHSTVTYISTEFITEKLGFAVLLPALTICVGYAAGRALARAMRLPVNERGVMSVLFSMSNTMFIGLPLCVAVFGEWTAPYVMSYMLSNTLIFWTLGSLSISGKAGVRQVFSPPLTAFLAGMAVALPNVPVPDFIMEAARILAGMATPVALLVVGGVLARMERPRVPKMVTASLLGRFVFMPALTFAACSLLGASNQATVVYTAVSAMPVMNQAVLVSRVHGNCAEEAAQAFTLSVLCAMAVIPLLGVLMGGLV